MARQTFTFNKTQLWTTTDGINFTQKTLPTGINSNNIATLTVHNGKLFLIGDFSTPSGKFCHRSDDSGSTWNQVSNLTSIAGIQDGAFAKIISFNGALWYLGHQVNTIKTNTVLRSDDEGVTWVNVPQGSVYPDAVGSYFLLGTQLLLSNGPSINWKTSDFLNYTVFTQNSSTPLNLLYSTGSAVFYMKHDGNAQQIYRSTDGTNFTKLTSFVYGDPEYGIAENLPPNLAFMDTGDYVQTTEFNGRLYFIHKINKAVMSAPTSAPTNLRSESNSNIPNLVLPQNIISGDITFSATPSPLTITANFATAGGFVVSPTITGTPTTISWQATFSSIGGFTANAVLLALSETSTESISLSTNAGFSASGQLISSLTIDSIFSSKAGLSGSAIIYDIPSYVLTGNVAQNGINYAGAKIIAIRENDHKVYSTISDTLGEFSILVDIGNYYVMVVYSNGADVKVSQPKYTVVT